MPTLYTRTGGNGSGVFPHTRWSLVSRVLDPGSRAGTGTRRDAYAELVTTYWRPVYRTLRVKHRQQREAAEDLTQAFFMHLLEKKTLEKFVADPHSGRFRNLLRSLLDRFNGTAQRDARRLKRGGEYRHVSLDPAQIDAIEQRIATSPPEDPFDSEWRATVIDNALQDLANEATSTIARRRLEVFLAYEVEPSLDAEGNRPTYADLARDLGLQAHDVKNDLVAARRRFAELILERVREDVRGEEEAREELRLLFGVNPQ